MLHALVFGGSLPLGEEEFMGNLIVAVLLVVFTASALAFLFRDR